MEQPFKPVEYKINIYNSLTNNVTVQQNSSPNSTFADLQHDTFDSKLSNSIVNFNNFVCQKEKAFEIPFDIDCCELEGEQSSFSSSSNTEDIYKENLLSEGFNSTHCANILK